MLDSCRRLPVLDSGRRLRVSVAADSLVLDCGRRLPVLDCGCRLQASLSGPCLLKKKSGNRGLEFAVATDRLG